MYSVKPGRGPSAMGVVGAIVAVIFGIGWTVTASNMGAPPFFTVFGIGFVVIAIIGGIYNAYNAVAHNRFSHIDVVSSSAEVDPLDPRSRGQSHPSAAVPGNPAAHKFCPHCGAGLAPDFAYCPKCGKPL